MPLSANTSSLLSRMSRASMKRHSSVMLLPSRVDETKSSHSSISSNSSGCGSMNDKGTYRSSFVHGDVQKEMVARNEAQKVNYCQFSSNLLSFRDADRVVDRWNLLSISLRRRSSCYETNEK